MTERLPELDALLDYMTDHIERNALVHRKVDAPEGFDLDAMKARLAEIEKVVDREQRAQDIAIKVICHADDADRILAAYDRVLAKHARDPMSSLLQSRPRPIEVCVSDLVESGTAITYDPLHYGGREYPWSDL